MKTKEYEHGMRKIKFNFMNNLRCPTKNKDISLKLCRTCDQCISINDKFVLCYRRRKLTQEELDKRLKK